ncbi:MAG: O-antigen ligase family protein [Accumulibacter sp.]|jgi:hypothetical protein
MRFGKAHTARDWFVACCLGLFLPALAVLKGPGYQPFSPAEVCATVLLLGLTALGVLSQRESRQPIAYYLLTLSLIATHIVISLGGDLDLAAFASVMLHDRYILVSLIAILFLTEEGEELITKVVIYLAVLTAYVVVGYVLQEPDRFTSLFGVGGFARETSIFPNSNMYGVYVVCVILLCLPRIDSLLFGKPALTYLFIVAPLFLVTLLSFSRRAWLVLAVGCILFAAFRRGKSLAHLALWMLLMGVIISLLDQGAIVDRFLLIFDSGYASNTERLDAGAQQMEVVMSHPVTFLLGAGVGEVGPASELSSRGQWLQIDNYFMQVVLEFGVVGLLVYCALFFYVVGSAVSVLRGASLSVESHNRLLSYLLVMLALYVVAIVGSTPITFPLNLLQWLIVGIIVNFIERARRRGTRKRMVSGRLDVAVLANRSRLPR